MTDKTVAAAGAVQYSTRRYIYMLISLVLFITSMISIAIYWQLNKSNIVEITADKYHLFTMMNCSQMQEEVQLIETYYHEISDHHRISGEYEFSDSFNLNTSLFILKEKLNSIKELQQHYAHREYATVLKNADNMLSRLIKMNSEAGSDVDAEVNEMKAVLAQFSIFLEQLQRLHTNAYTDTMSELIIKRPKAFRNILLFLFIPGIIGVLLTKKILNLIRSSESALKSAVEGLQSEIYERKRIEEILKVSEKKYRNIVENALVGVYKSNMKGKPLYVNEAFSKMLEYDSPEEMMSFDAPAGYKNPGDREIYIENLKKKGRVDSFETELLTKTGNTRQVLTSGTLEGDELSGIVIDITERKKLEEQLLQSQKMESIGILAGGIAHDFNNILTAIIGFSHTLGRKISEDTKLKFYTDQIEAAAEIAAALTKDLLTFSRKQKNDPVPFSFNVLIRRLKEMLLRIAGEDIEFSIALSEESDLHVMMDFNQMHQVLMNLVSNARDAMPDGGVLNIATKPFDIDNEFIDVHGFGRPGQYALILISDTGTGMDDNTKEKIFEPFFTSKEVDKGTGLGLSTVYGIIKQHKGYIEVESKPGKGTTFSIYLPLITQAVEVTGVKQYTPSDNLDGTETILVAEDNPMVRKFISSVLLDSGYKVIAAEDGEKALKTFMENKDSIQFIISDVIMPKKSGPEVHEEIRKLKPDIKYLFLSGYSPEKIDQKDIIEKGQHFMFKPVKPADLLRKVRDILDNNL